MSDDVAKIALHRPASPMRSSPMSSRERSSLSSALSRALSRALQLMMIDFRVLPAAALKAR